MFQLELVHSSFWECRRFDESRLASVWKNVVIVDDLVSRNFEIRSLHTIV